MRARECRAQLLQRASVTGLMLPGGLADRLVAYYELLERWNRTINLTSLAETAASLDRLLLEPVAAAAYLPSGPFRLMDVGSGGGSPAIPLALAAPESCLVMVESRTRKAAFLREAIRALSLARATVEVTRAEDLSAAGSYTRSIDALSMRAVRASRTLLLGLTGFLRPEGLMLLFRGAPAPGDELFRKLPGLRFIGENSLIPSSTSRLLRLRRS
jgi:16S rRNA (guanine527-N7)-methyltransferase